MPNLLTSYHYRLPTGALHRIPLTPLPSLGRLKEVLQTIRTLIESAPKETSYAALWASDRALRESVGECLTLNGLGAIEMGLGDRVALCIGHDGEPPLLATYNLLTPALTPVAVPSVTPESGSPLPSTPVLPKRTISQVLPLFDCDGKLVYSRGVMAAHHDEFESVFYALNDEARELQGAFHAPHPAGLLLLSEELRAYAMRLIELWGIDPTRLNIHQVCELAFVFEEGPGLLPQLSGLTDTEESDGAPIPETPSMIHFVLGALGQSGIHDWQALLSGLTYPELRSYQQGLSWNPKVSDAKRNKAERDDVFDRWFGEGSTGEVPTIRKIYDRARQTPA